MMWCYEQNNQTGGSNAVPGLPVASETRASGVARGEIVLREEERRALISKISTSWKGYTSSLLGVILLPFVLAIGIALMYAPAFQTLSQPMEQTVAIVVPLVYFAIIAANGMFFVYNFVMLYRLWQVVPKNIANTTPGCAVGLLFIPLFNICWYFIAYVSLAERYREMLIQQNDRRNPAPLAYAMGVVVAICFLMPIFLAFSLPLIAPNIETVQNTDNSAVPPLVLLYVSFMCIFYLFIFLAWVLHIFYFYKMKNCALRLLNGATVVDVPSAHAQEMMNDNAWLVPVRTSGLAIIAGYLGLFSVLILPAPFALLFGILALHNLRKNPGLHGYGRAWFGIIMSILSSIGFLLLMIAILGLL
ncbi:MAG: DUF4190 domain-containing protein [Planctomycetia bacterium]|nr:DUF4190 domain-containing protein [Planctomycetia bacterium]